MSSFDIFLVKIAADEKEVAPSESTRMRMRVKKSCPIKMDNKIIALEEAYGVIFKKKFKCSYSLLNAISLHFIQWK